MLPPFGILIGRKMDKKILKENISGKYYDLYN
jgi:hypothetical protein